ncbi:glycosyltransferase family 4 protein [Dysgonomonas macrotermitis]|uniref:Glycosyltransferase involved in cell wall bisynthesis n=1 Tax=Dysgonomonas macrotermitis TaxID=1346286 RepID=A0A1M5I4K7_9BACT|nr:glycosyltransferase family 4 protein [Dysgonomonas macrotermitis]SHG23205.1 Glycosyltransferase involved in cell wall bisynthesis [Dysgonomonas macrotermitis]
MKSILIVTEVFYPENGLINDFVKELQERGYKVDVLTQYPSYPESVIFPGYKNEYYSIERWGEVTIHRFKLVEGYKNSIIKKILNYWTFVKVGKKIARKIGNEYDHILVYQTGPLTVGLPAVEIKKKFRKALTIWTFDIWPDTVYAYGFPKIFPLTYCLDRFIKKIYSSCDNILVSSEGFIKSIQKYVPDKEILYSPNWMIKEEQEVCPLRLDRGKFNFTFTGNISVSQNLENVLLGWELADLDNAILNIVGDGSSLQTLKQIIEERKIKNVKLFGRYPSNQIADILSQSDTLVLSLIPNHGIDKTEPFKIQSYLQSGKPILGVIAGAGRCIILDNQLGLCSSPTDITDIAEKFRNSLPYALENYSRIALSSKRLIKERFNRELIIDRVISIIEK